MQKTKGRCQDHPNCAHSKFIHKDCLNNSSTAAVFLAMCTRRNGPTSFPHTTVLMNSEGVTKKKVYRLSCLYIGTACSLLNNSQHGQVSMHTRYDQRSATEAARATVNFKGSRGLEYFYTSISNFVQPTPHPLIANSKHHESCRFSSLQLPVSQKYCRSWPVTGLTGHCACRLTILTY